MTKSKKTPAASTDPATSHLKLLETQRKRASRVLLKRRRQKSGQ